MTGNPPPNPSDASGADVPHHASHGEIPNSPAAPQGESLPGGDQREGGASRDVYVNGEPRDVHVDAREPRDHAAPDAFEGDDDERHDVAPPPPREHPTGVRRADGLTAGQERAIVALMAEPSIAKAARSANVGERTLHSWLAEPEFSRAYRDARRRAFAQAIALTHKMAAAAVQTLAKVMIDTTAPHAARVSAASSLLRFSRESIELDDLAARLEDLEGRLKEEP